MEGDLPFQVLAHNLVGVGKLKANLQSTLLPAYGVVSAGGPNEVLFPLFEDSSTLSIRSTVGFFGFLTKRWAGAGSIFD